jgi:Tol biopolymer transport system component
MKPKLLYLGCLAAPALTAPLHTAYAGITALVSAPSPSLDLGGFPGGTSQPKLSPDGRFLVFAAEADLLESDANGKQDIYLLDRNTGAVELVSVGFRGQQADGDSGSPSVSGDGRFVAFESSAANLEFTQDLRGYGDIFLRDRQAGLTRRISAGPDGREANGDSFEPAVSADGGRVAFSSRADDLVGGDHNGVRDIFVFHRPAGAVERVSVASSGAEALCSEWFWPCSSSPAMSADGRYVAFSSFGDNLVPDDHNQRSDIFVRDIAEGTTTRVSVASGGGEARCPVDAFYCRGSFDPAISADGRYVAFASYADNLVADDSNSSNSMDIFLHDRASATTTRVSLASGGTEGRCVVDAFYCQAGSDPAASAAQAGNLAADGRGNSDPMDSLLPGSASATATRASVAIEGGVTICYSDNLCPGSAHPSVSDDGRYVAFESVHSNLVPDDANKAGDIFVRDTALATTTRVSVAGDGTEARCPGQFCAGSSSPTLSSDGRSVAFVSDADYLAAGDFNMRPDIFVRDMPLGPILRASAPTAAGPLMRMANCSNPSCSGSSNAAVSADGRYVAFDSGIDKLVAGDHDGFRDVFLRDTVAGTITRVSVASGGTEARCSGARYCYGSSNPAVNADGRYVAFQSDAGNLVPDDRNDQQDIFLRDTVLGTTTRVSVANDGTEANGPSDNAAMSADGRYVAFESYMVAPGLPSARCRC